MNRTKKLSRLLLVVAMLVGLGIPTRTARANCLIEWVFEDGTSGFISCGSSAGPYIAQRTENGYVTYDGGLGLTLFCAAMAC